MPEAGPPRDLLAEAGRALRFALAGLANTLLGGGVIVLLDWGCGLDPHLANAGGFAVGTVVGFFLNRYFVFRAGHSSAPVPRYVATIVVAFLANQLVLAACRGWLPPLPGKAVLAQGAAMATYTVISFLLCRLWVFRRVAGLGARSRSPRVPLAKAGGVG